MLVLYNVDVTLWGQRKQRRHRGLLCYGSIPMDDGAKVAGEF